MLLKNKDNTALLFKGYGNRPIAYELLKCKPIRQAKLDIRIMFNIINRLSVRINALIIILVFLPALFAAVYFMHKFDLNLKQELLTEASVQMRERTEKAISNLKFLVSDVNLASSNVQNQLNSDLDLAMKSMVALPPPEFYKSAVYKSIADGLQRELMEGDNILQFRLINVTGREVVRFERTDDAIVEIPIAQLQDKSHRFYFKQTIVSEKNFAQMFQPTLNKEYGEISLPHALVFRIAKKIFLKNGELFGILVLNVNSDMIFGSKLSDKESGFLVIDEDGTYLHHWDEKVLFGNDLGHSANLLAEEPELAVNLNRQDSKIHWDPELTEYRVWQKLFYNSHDSSKYLVFMERVYESMLAAPWASTIKKAFFTFLLISIVSLALIILAMNRMLRPISTLMASIRKLEGGDLEARVNVTSKTEIGKLGAAFNDMAENLQKKTGLIKLQQEITVTANGALTREEAMLVCLEKICSFTGWDAGHVYMTDSQGNLVPTNLWHVKNPERFKHLIRITESTTLTPGVGLPGCALNNRKPIWFPDMTREQNFPRAKEVMESGIKGGFGFPVFERNRVSAVLEFFSSKELELDESLIETVSYLSTQLGRVTERKKSEQELQKSKDCLEKLSNSFGAVIAIVKMPERVIEYINHGAEDMFGYTVDECLGKGTEMLYKNKEDFLDFGRKAEGAIKRRVETLNVEQLFQRKNGETFQAELIVTFLKMGDNVTDMIGIVRDVTKRNEAEKALVLAKEAAESSNKAKSVFLSSISHELRTPLNSVIGFSQLLVRDIKNPLTVKQKEMLTRITNAGDQLLELINDVLDLSKIESGKVEISIEDIDMNSIVLTAMAAVGTLAEEHKIELVRQNYLDGFYVKADRVRLIQVLTNLLTNAIKYNRENGEVVLSYEPMNLEKVRIKVSDTGMGIPKDLAERIFEPFERLGKESLDIDGTGIGMTIVKRLVEAMNGGIGVESEVGKGTLVYIDLPLGKRPEQRIEKVLAAEESQAPKTMQRKFKLLYVEDNSSNMELVKDILESERPNIEMISSESAEKGIELARSCNPDIILMDINMHGMTGFEALKCLQGSKEICDIPVVALSGSVMGDEIKEGVAAGFVSYITKPLEIGKFISTLDEFLTGTRKIANINVEPKGEV